MNKEVTLIQNCIATIIPAGDEITLSEGSTFSIAQSLGGSVTLRDASGMYRVGESQLDALGEEVRKEVAGSQKPTEEQGSFSEEKVWDAMRGCYDPEIPVNIYELGLIYTIDINAENEVNIKMSLTAPGCPVAGEMPGWVADAVEPLPGVKTVDVELVWEPPWGMDMMSDEARLEPGFM